ncbi:hypothetical protein ACT91Q_04990 [Brevibacillus thermoruber]
MKKTIAMILLSLAFLAAVSVLPANGSIAAAEVQPNVVDPGH